MEQEHTQSATSTESPAQPPRTAPRGFTRCRARNRKGSRCRLHAQDPLIGLCFRHANRPDAASEDPDLSGELFPNLPDDELPDLSTAENLNEMFSRIVMLLAEGRISPRRAAVMTFGCSLLLRSVVVMDRADSEVETRYVLDLPRPHGSSEEDDDPRFPEGSSTRPQT